jgi:hypothetical protein
LNWEISLGSQSAEVFEGVGMVFEKCRDILLRESKLVQRIACLQNLIRDAVINRDWTDFEGHFNVLGGIKEEFSALESERDRLFTGMPAGADGAARFYAFAARFPAEQRGELTKIYRSLKLEPRKIQISGETLMTYIAEARATMAGFFEIAFPDRGGKMYTPHGIPVSHDMRSMVLNQCF